MPADDEMTLEITSELETILHEFIRAVSFAPDEQPCYETLHGLFVEDGKLIRTSSLSPEIATVDEFIAPRQAMVDSGELTSFQEAECRAITHFFGNVAHRFSVYEKSGVLNGTPFAGRGIISTQFVRTPNGWRISSMAWDDERPGLTIPDRLGG